MVYCVLFYNSSKEGSQKTLSNSKTVSFSTLIPSFCSNSSIRLGVAKCALPDNIPFLFMTLCAGTLGLTTKLLFNNVNLINIFGT